MTDKLSWLAIIGVTILFLLFAWLLFYKPVPKPLIKNMELYFVPDTITVEPGVP